MASKMKLTLVGDREILITRTFNAPLALVFEANTKPELLKRWMTGPPGWSFEVCEVDLRVGGSYRYVWRGPDGVLMGMGGVIMEMDPPRRMVSTALFDTDWTGGETIGTLTLTELGGQTLLTNSIVYQTAAARDGALKTPMEQGMAAGYDRLENLLGTYQGH